MTSLVERMQANDPELTDLRLTELPQAYTADMAELIAAFKANNTIEFIRFDRDFLPGVAVEDLLPLFQAVGALPSLKEALIWHASLPISVITGFLNAAKGTLEHLQLGVLDLEGSEDDMDQVAESLSDHDKLKSFELIDFSLNDDSISIDKILATLATLPNLERVKLEVSYQKRGSLVGTVAASKRVKVELTGAALAKLCQSTSVKELHLTRVKMPTPVIQELADSIITSPAIKSIAVTHCGMEDDACAALAVAIGQSKTLESVDLSCNQITDEGCIAIATALTGNQSVKFLRLWGNVKISNHGFEALVDMLESNCVLERVPLMASSDYKQRIDTKLSANRAKSNAAA